MTDNTPKEILKKIDSRYIIWDEEMFDDSMREYSEYKKERIALRGAAHFGYSLSQAELKEKDEQLKQSLLLYQNMCNQIAKDNDEIERLKGLLERVVTREYSEVRQTEKNKKEVWENFKTENKIL